MKKAERDMADDVSFLEYGFKGAVTIILTAGGWLWSRTMIAVSKNRDEIVQHGRELSDHKLYAANTFATKTDMNSTMTDIKDTMKRVHERIDGIFEILQQGGKK